MASASRICGGDGHPPYRRARRLVLVQARPIVQVTLLITTGGRCVGPGNEPGAHGGPNAARCSVWHEPAGFAGERDFSSKGETRALIYDRDIACDRGARVIAESLSRHHGRPGTLYRCAVPSIFRAIPARLRSCLESGRLRIYSSGDRFRRSKVAKRSLIPFRWHAGGSFPGLPLPTRFLPGQ